LPDVRELREKSVYHRYVAVRLVAAASTLKSEATRLVETA
jgi:hypothetical protein